MPHRMSSRRVDPLHPVRAGAGVATCAALAALAACGGKDGTGPASVVPTRLAFAAQPDSGLVGDTLVLGTTAVDASGRGATDPRIKFSYTSTDTTVVRVSAAGVVRYVGPGSAIINATATGVPGGASLSLSTDSLRAFAPAARVRPLPSRIDVAPGTVVALSAVVYDSGGNVITYPLRYGTGNAGVASVSGSTATAAAAGTAELTVRADFRGRGVSATVPVAVTPTPQGAFHIDLVQSGTVNPAYAQVFARAAAFWQGVVTAALPGAPLDVPSNECGFDEPALKTTTTGVAIFFRVDSIDGPGAVLGAAGPCVLRQDASSQQRGLTALGTMVFDSADFNRLVQRGTAYDVVRHEMGHVLGVGTLWNIDGVHTYLLGRGGPDPRYAGTGGESGSSVLGFTPDGVTVPVENTGGDGTADSHWRSSVFGSELMTGYLSSAPTHPASRLTVLSLADLGYQVNVAASEPLQPASPAALRAVRAALAVAAADRVRDIALPPLFAIKPGGGLRRLRSPLPLEARLRLR